MTPAQFAASFGSATHVIFNTFAHVNFFMDNVVECYEKHAPPANVSSKAVVSHEILSAFAELDVLRFWRSQIDLIASELRARRVRASYRSSPAPATILCEGSNETAVWRATGGPEECRAPLSNAAYDLSANAARWGALDCFLDAEHAFQESGSARRGAEALVGCRGSVTRT